MGSRVPYKGQYLPFLFKFIDYFSFTLISLAPIMVPSYI